MDAAEADRARRLFEEGATILAARWDDAVAMVRDGERSDTHTPRGTLAFCHVLLRRGDVAQAERAIAAVLELQERNPGDAHYGNFRWLREHPCVNDLNAVEFVLDELIAVLRDHAAALSPATVAAVREAIALGLREIERLDVHLSYTNIALSDIANSVLGGELLGDAHAAARGGNVILSEAKNLSDRGARKLDAWLAFTAASGAPHEFNSATYVAVDILRVAALAAGTSDPAIRAKAMQAEALLWRHAAAHYHPGLAQLAGPHSRSYWDGWSGAGGYLKLILWRLLGDDRLRQQTPYASHDREEGHVGVAVAELHCPPDALASLREKAYPFASRETSDAARGLHLTTYMTAAYALGSATASYTVGDPPEPSTAFDSLHAYIARGDAPGYSALYVRYVIDDHAPSAAEPDHWDQGQHVAAQEGSRAIVAYGLVPRVRPMRSAMLSLRLLGFRGDDAAWVDGVRVDRFPVRVGAGARVVLAAGETYVAIIPLEQTDIGHDAPILLRLESDVLTLDIYNYLGPPNSPWEFRSQAGAFYHGNIRSAFAIELAGRDEYTSAEAFIEHVARAVVTDTTAGHDRTITYFSEGGATGLTYSLWDMRASGR